MCKALDVSRSSFYEWLNRDPSLRDIENQTIKEEIEPVFDSSNGTYGRRRLSAALEKKGVLASVNRIERRMKELDIQGYRPRAYKITTIGNSKLKNSPNLLKDENIVAEALNQVWVTDITYIATKEGWLYLCMFLDLCSRKIIGWSMEDNMKASMVNRALRMAIKTRKPKKGLIVHSDCGGQFKAKSFRSILWNNKIRQSMTHAGNCYDNATAESFFGTLKNELIRGVKFETRESAKAAIFEYIESFYNRARLHSSLGYNSPMEFEENIA